MRKITLEQVKNLWRSRDHVNPMNKFCDWELQEEYTKTFMYIYFIFELDERGRMPQGWPDFFENRKIGVKLWEVESDEKDEEDDYQCFWTNLENRMQLTDPGDEDNKEWDLLEAMDEINKVLEEYYERYDEEYEPTEEFARAMEGIYN